MLNNPHFYHRSIRKVVVAFGTVFNDIEVIRYNKDGSGPKERFKVPLSYGAKEKYLTRLMSDPSLNKSVAVVIPRISFNLDGMKYDYGRKQVSTLRNFAQVGNTTTLNAQYAPVPYDFNFSMSVYVRNTEDGTQILEQILPFFTPDFNVTVDFIPDMNPKYDMPIILGDVRSNVEYEGDFSTTRLITWDMDFTVKAFIWPPIKTSGLIRSANTNIYQEGSNSSIKVVNILTRPDPIDAQPDDEYGFSETITEYDYGRNS